MPRLLLRCVLPALLLPLDAAAASLSIQVLDRNGQPARDAVVYAEPETPAAPARNKTIQIEQRDSQFLPRVSAVQSGSFISFPNNDTVRHHVYSFSPAKTFEVRLYKGVPKNPEKFDKAGTVTLGCNIHDQMIAWVHVVDTPYFAKTDANGRAVLDGLGAGKYTLKAWHPAMPENQPVPGQAIALTGAESAVPYKLALKVSAAPADGAYQPKQFKY
jgi:plastocyanin